MSRPRLGPFSPASYNLPMKSEPPTPTRAPDNQSIKLQVSTKLQIRSTRLLNLSGLGSVVPTPSVSISCRPPAPPGRAGPRKKIALSLSLSISLYIYIYIYI